MRRRRFLAILAAAALPGAATGSPAQGRRIALGAEAAITLHGPREITEPALAEAWAVVERADALFSLYRPDSALSRLNREGRLDDPPAELVALLALARRLHEATGGLFDPTVQPLWRALAEGRDPAPARARVGFGRVRVTPGRVDLGSGQALTLNGIAQGYATDLVREALARRGLTRALVDIGEAGALGGPWRIGIEDPAEGLLGQVTLDGTAVATSSPGALTLPGGAAHILSPRAGLAPLWSTISVTAPSAALADGLSTAFCLATAAEIRTCVAALGEPVAVRAVDASGALSTL